MGKKKTAAINQPITCLRTLFIFYHFTFAKWIKALPTIRMTIRENKLIVAPYPH
jgi:hypothetical protein